MWTGSNIHGNSITRDQIWVSKGRMMSQMGLAPKALARPRRQSRHQNSSSELPKTSTHFEAIHFSYLLKMRWISCLDFLCFFGPSLGYLWITISPSYLINLLQFLPFVFFPGRYVRVLFFSTNIYYPSQFSSFKFQLIPSLFWSTSQSTVFYFVYFQVLEGEWILTIILLPVCTATRTAILEWYVW